MLIIGLVSRGQGGEEGRRKKGGRVEGAKVGDAPSIDRRALKAFRIQSKTTVKLER